MPSSRSSIQSQLNRILVGFWPHMVLFAIFGFVLSHWSRACIFWFPVMCFECACFLFCYLGYFLRRERKKGNWVGREDLKVVGWERGKA